MFNHTMKQTHDFAAAIMSGDVATPLEMMFRGGREKAKAAIKAASELEPISVIRAMFVELFDSYTDQFRELGATERQIAELKRTYFDGFDATVSRRPES
jgi:hypothetical protein